MKHVVNLRLGAFAIAFLFIFSSCRKDLIYLNQFPNPLKPSANPQVIDFHNNRLDLYLPAEKHFLFTKYFDHSGKLNEIICGFDNAQSGYGELANIHDLHIYDKGRILYFVQFDSTGHPSDTTVRVYLNPSGRPDSAVANYHLFFHYPPDLGGEPDTLAKERTYFSYSKDRRLLSVEDVDYSGSVITSSRLDSLTYDQYGNVVTFGAGYTYEYDYTRKPKQQFYPDNLIKSENGFYLLQYLGYFPEMTTPVNLRTSYTQRYPHFPHLIDSYFDSQDRLTIYRVEEDFMYLTWSGN